MVMCSIKQRLSFVGVSLLWNDFPSNLIRQVLERKVAIGGIGTALYSLLAEQLAECNRDAIRHSPFIQLGHVEHCAIRIFDYRPMAVLVFLSGIHSRPSCATFNWVPLPGR